MEKAKKRIVKPLVVIFVIVVLFCLKLPNYIGHFFGYYTLSEAMETESYGLIYKTLDRQADNILIKNLKLSKPKLKHMEIVLQKEWRDVMELFIVYGANPNQMDSEGYTILDRAILHNSFGMCSILLNNKLVEELAPSEDWSEQIYTDVNMKNKYGNTALDELCKISNDEMLEGEWEKRVQLLLEHGAEITEQTRSILKESVHKNKLEWVNSLSQNKNKKSNNDFAKDDMEQIREKWAQKTFTKDECYNLLQKLQKYQSEETIKLVLEELHLQKYLDEKQKEDLMVRAVIDDSNIMNLYLEKNFPVTSKALGEVIWTKNFSDMRVKDLVNKETQGTIIKNWKNNQDYSLFMIAVEADRADLISDLYFSRANLNYKNKSGLTAKKISKKYGFDTINSVSVAGPDYFEE